MKRWRILHWPPQLRDNTAWNTDEGSEGGAAAGDHKALARSSRCGPLVASP